MDWKTQLVIIMTVLVTAIYFAIPTFQAYSPGGDPLKIEGEVNLGLDLQGGMYLDVQVLSEEAVNKVTERTAQELEDLFLDNSVNYITVDQTSERQIFIELALNVQVNLEEPPYARFVDQFDIIANQNTYRLDLKEEEYLDIKKKAIQQAVEVIRNRIDALGVAEPSIQRQGENNIVIQLPGLKDRDKAIALLGPQAVLEFKIVSEYATENNYNPVTQEVKYEEILDPVSKEVISRQSYVLEKKVLLTGDFIRDARVNFDQNNIPYVSLSFDGIGTERFANITRRNRGRRLAIVLDDKVQSAPVIREAITGGEASISGRFTVEEAGNLALVLRSGSLPAPIDIREERTVGASLGEDSVRQSVMALVTGMVCVLVFMVVYYKVSGLFANVALLFNLVLILSVLGAMGATLTLPGMAGIVLTIGMAVDANVLIFQRIREELKVSQKPRLAVKEGFGRAFSTILDANVTTLIGAIALLQFGSGPIKGFAVTLSIGILASMFTAIVVTRFLFEIIYLNRKNLQSISI